MTVTSTSQALHTAIQLRHNLTTELTTALRELPLIREGELRAKERTFQDSINSGEAISVVRERLWASAIDFTIERYKLEAEIEAIRAQIEQADMFIRISLEGDKG